MSRLYVTTPPGVWLQKLTPFSVAGTSFLTAGLPGATGAGWMRWGDMATALWFVVINSGTGDLLVTPEASWDGVYADAGPMKPQAGTALAGTAYGDPYGVDEARQFWRLSVQGLSTGQWGVLGIPR